MGSIDYIRMAHDQLDLWIAGEIANDYWPYTTEVINLGKLKNTMVKAREQYIEENPKYKFVTIAGEKYTEAEIIEALKALDWQCREPHCPWKHNDRGSHDS